MKKLLLLLCMMIFMAGAFLWGVSDGGVLAEKLGLARGNGDITVAAYGQVSVDTRQDVEKAAKGFAAFCENNLAVKLNRDVRVLVAPDRNSYQALLVKEMEMTEAEAKNKAQYTSGQASGQKGLCVINGDKNGLKESDDRLGTTAHELFHQLQYQLSDGHNGYEQGLFWLEEGSADYMGAQVAAAVGGRSVEKWFLDAKFTVQNSRKVADIMALQHTTEAQRSELMNNRVNSYGLADLMTWFLVKNYAAGQENAKLLEYYRRLGQGERAEESLQNTFGVSLDAFLTEFVDWWQKEQHKTAFNFQGHGNVRPAVVEQLQAQVNAAQEWLARHWGRRLTGEYDIIVAANQEDLAKVAEEQCRISPERARQLAAGSVWVENNSTLIVNGERIADQRQCIFVGGVMMARMLEVQELGAEPCGVEWLMRGIGYVVGVGRLCDNGYGRLTDYQRTWRTELRKKTPLPSLDKMMRQESMEEITGQYNHDDVAKLCEYATAELVRRYGWGSLQNWLLAARQTGDGRQAFTQVFGITATDFAAQIQMLIY